MVWALPVLLLVNTGQTQDIYLRGPRPDYNDDAPRTAAANVYAPEVSVPIPDDDSDVLTPPYWNLARKLYLFTKKIPGILGKRVIPKEVFWVGFLSGGFGLVPISFILVIGFKLEKELVYCWG